MRRSTIPISALLSALVFVTSACTDDPGNETRDAPLLVFAAASLTDAFAEIEVAYEAAHPGVDIRIVTAASSALRGQILAGAPGDVFASADPEIMAEVVAAGSTVGDPQVFAHNLMQIAVPRGNPAGIMGLGDFGDPERLIGLCAEQVPCGLLGRKVLSKAGVVPDIDTNEPNVRALLTKIEVDELDAGLVYVTDVRSSDLVEGISILSDWNAEATYPIAVLSSSASPTAAVAFVAFVLSPEGTAILVSHGFEAP